MKRIVPLILALCILSGCGSSSSETAPTRPDVQTEATLQTESIPATVPTTLAATAPAVETTTPTAPALHSPLYIDGISTDALISFFNEVCLEAEYVNSGDPSRLQKWTFPIYFSVHGDFTQEDLYVLRDFTAWLNTIEGFPGIWEAENPLDANLDIYFCNAITMESILGSNFVGMDGGVTFWYRNDKIYEAVICYRTDLTQELRNSVILEEIYNGLGPIQDTDLRDDSIIYSGFSMPQQLTGLDELILKLLYHPDMKCGMDADACAEVIRQLYY